MSLHLMLNSGTAVTN